MPVNRNLDAFSIHSFGFGSDHDEELMTNISNLKDGTFYFVNQLETLDIAFCNALGGIISLAAKDVEIKLANVAKKTTEGIKIEKTYGNMWKKIDENQYSISISQLMSGISKDFVFQLSIPSINAEAGDIGKDYVILESGFIATGINNERINGKCCLKLTLANENETILDINEDIEVIENYWRVRASASIE